MLNCNHELRDDCNLMSIRSADPHERHRAYGVFLWQKADVLNGGDRYPVTFDEESVIAVHISRYWQSLDGGRWLVRDGDTCYLSEATFAGARTTHELHPTNTRWAVYRPTAPYGIAFDASTTFAPRAFGDVTAVGFYLARDRLVWESVALKWHSVEVEAVVQRPERPGWLAELIAVPGADGLQLGTTEVPYELWQRVWRWAVSNQYCFGRAPGYVFDRDGDCGAEDLGDEAHDAREPVTGSTSAPPTAACWPSTRPPAGWSGNSTSARVCARRRG